jgi:ribosomal protein S18 acetylase RimI-like enzyme
VHSDFSIRGIDGLDRDFLEAMFVVAADWNAASAKGEEHWRADPMLEKYVGAWRDGSDFGFIVEASGEPLGAVWMRYFDAEDPGYGFVDEQTPEITLGVREGFRGQGIGRVLVQAAQDAAPASLSLSVEDGNRAIHLYESMGFVPVGRVGNSTTMLWNPAVGH